MSKWHRNYQSLRDLRHHIRLVVLVLRSLPSVVQAYWRRSRQSNTCGPVRESFFGISVEPSLHGNDRLIEALHDLGVSTTLVRFPMWDPEAVARARRLLRELESAGIEVIIALLQDRSLVCEPVLWRQRVGDLLRSLPERSRRLEVGHAWNRRKWGVWHLDEYAGLVSALMGLTEEFPDIRLIGPAVIDFEYHFVLGALVDSAIRNAFETVTSLLYVDRRGAPEKMQYGFDLTRKLRMLRAISDVGLSSSAECWVTEFNWPLRVSGEFSPVSYDRGFSPEQCADYLVRYYLLALADGMCHRIYWWQLAARGYGLVDDSSDLWRERPAYHAYRHMVQRLKGARVETADSRKKLRIIRFRDAEDRPWQVIWALVEEMLYDCGDNLPIEILDRDGVCLPLSSSIHLGSAPVYLRFPE